MDELAAAENRRAQRLAHLLDHLPRTLAPVNFLAAIGLLFLGGAGTWLVLDRRAESSSALAILGVLLLVLALGTVLADIAGTARALGLALGAEPLLRFLVALAGPVLAVRFRLLQWARAPQTTPHPPDRVTSDDIQVIVAEGHEPRKVEGIEPEEREMIAGIIEMSERTARDLMVPRIDVVALEVTCSLAEAVVVATKHGHSRLPVYAEDIDHVVGILYVKDLIQLLSQPERKAALREMLRPVHYVPDTARADDLLRDLLRKRVHMAVVVDEYGGTAGVVTVEDALEEIVGEIRDEYDAAEEPDFVRVSEEEAVFNARVPIGEVNDALGVNLPTEGSDTLGGIVYAQLGKMPKVGDQVRVGVLELTVTAVAGRRLKKVRVRNLKDHENAEAATQSDGQTNQS